MRVTVFECGRAAESAHQMQMGPCHQMGRVLKWHVCGRGEKALKNIRFKRSHIEILQLGLNVIKMALENQSELVLHKLNIRYRGSP